MEQNSIDVKALLLKLWAKKYVFLTTWVVTAVATFGLTFLLTVRWEASTEFVEQHNLQEWRNLQSIAWNSSIDAELAPSASVLQHNLFPSIVNSASFLDELMAQPLVSAQGQTIRAVMLQKDTLKRHVEQLDIVRNYVSCKVQRRTGIVTLSVTTTTAESAVEATTIARELLANRVNQDLLQARERNLTSYEQNKDNNATAALLYDITRLELSREEPIFAVLSEAEEPLRPTSPRRLMLTALALVLVTMGMTCWYWRKDIPQWL